MVICLRKNGCCQIIDIFRSEFDQTTAIVLRKNFRKLINNNNVNILINFSNVLSINISDLACILFAQKLCKKNGGRIDFYGVRTELLLLFYIVQFDKSFNIYNSEIEAVLDRNRLVRRRLKVIKG